MDGLDDFRVVDPAQISGRDREIGVPELSLDHDQRDPLPGHLDRVRVPQLVLVPTSAQTPLSRPLSYADVARCSVVWRGFVTVRSA